MDDTATRSTLAGRYRLETRIGSGGAGDVWRATDTTLARTVAVKMLHPGLQDDERTVERFKREAAAAAALSHPHAVITYDVGHDDGCDFLVMEYVDGASLADVLRGGAMEHGDVAAIGAQVAEALAAAHDQGLIHRDIKPANILVSRDGVAKVADFGIAKAMGDAQARLTATGTIVGSAAYVAPEQLRDEDVDGRADVYALGLMLHECLTGQRPFGDGNPAEVAVRRLTADPDPPSAVRPDLPPELDDIIVMATQRDREDRFSDAGRMASALRALTPANAARRLAALADRFATHPAVSTAILPQDARYGPTAIGASQTVRIRARPDVDDRAVTAPRPAAVEENLPILRDDTERRRRSRNGQHAETSEHEEAPRDRTPLVAAGILLLAVLGVAALVNGGGSDPATEAGGSPSAGDGPIAVAGALDYDPFGGGSEHRDEVPLAYDGDPGTAWTTERYSRPNLGGLKPGTGVWFDLGQPHDVGSISLTLGRPGVDLQVFAGPTPPQGDPAAWGTRIASITDAPQQVTIDVPSEVRSQYFLVWITKVSGGRGALAEVTFSPR